VGGQPFPGNTCSVRGKFAKVHTAKVWAVRDTGTVAIQAALKAIGIKPGTK